MAMAGSKTDSNSSLKRPYVQLLVPETSVINHDNDQQQDAEEIEYPLNTKPLQNQVAGHAFKDGKCTIGMLKHNDGYVLKPVNRPIQGGKEIKFYEEMQEVVDPILIEFKTFIPEYYGTTILDLNGKKVTFLLLKDITNGFEEPCIMDIKIGRQTWEPGAPFEKQQSEQKKYTECKKTLNFCIPGFQRYDIETGTFQKYGKDYGKKLDVNGVYDAMRLFFNADNGVGERLLIPVISKLKEILKWWNKQNIYHIYSSSVLLAYDAAVIRKTLCNKSSERSSLTTFANCINHSCNSNDESQGKDSDFESLSQLCVYLIDFAHVVSAENNTPDYNYINGLVSLITVLENLLAEFRLRRN